MKNLIIIIAALTMMSQKPNKVTVVTNEEDAKKIQIGQQFIIEQPDDPEKIDLKLEKRLCEITKSN